jgi:serralysin
MSGSILPANLPPLVDWLTEGFWTHYGRQPAKWDASAPITFGLFGEWTGAERGAALAALGLWSDAAAITFAEAATPEAAQIRFEKNTEGSAFARDTRADGVITAATISIDARRAGFGPLDDPGDYGFMTLLHEVGHALGLGHGGAYNGDVTPETEVIFYADSLQFTLMSYNEAQETGAAHKLTYAMTPLLVDVLAIRSLYGAAAATRIEDTTYGFNGNTGNPIFDFTEGVKPVLAIVDSGGTDTLDLSGFARGSVASLVPGRFGDVGGLTKNLVIAFDSWIENLVGGGGADTLRGNALSNRIEGGLDGDWLSAGDGERGAATSDAPLPAADTLIGGDGADKLIGGYGGARAVADLLDGGLGRDTYYADSSDIIIDAGGRDFLSIVLATSYALPTGIETTYVVLQDAVVLTGTGRANAITLDSELGFGGWAEGLGGADSISGTTQGDTLIGGRGNDSLSGNSGDDRLAGGAGRDTLVGGAGQDLLIGGGEGDVFRYGEAAGGGDTIHDFDAADVIEVSAAGFRGKLEAGLALPGSRHYAANDDGLATARAGVGQFVWEADAGSLWWDADGIGAGARVLIATFAQPDAWDPAAVQVVA